MANLMILQQPLFLRQIISDLSKSQHVLTSELQIEEFADNLYIRFELTAAAENKIRSEIALISTSH